MRTNWHLLVIHSPRHSATKFGNCLAEPSADATDNETFEFRIAVETVLGALPDLDRPLGLDLVEIDQHLIRQRYAAGAAILRLGKDGETAVADEYEMERRRRAGFSTFWDELVLGPIRIVRDYLSAMTYVGPHESPHFYCPGIAPIRRVP